MTPSRFLRRSATRFMLSSSRYLKALGLFTCLAARTAEAAPDAQAKEVGVFSVNSNVNDIQVVNKTAYIAAGDDGLLILDASDPAHLLPLGTYDTPGQAYAVQVIGNRAYVSDSGEGFEIIDVSNPQAPTLLGSYAPGFWVSESRVVGDRAYVACSEGGIHILDISDPANIVKLGEYLHPVDPFGAYASGLRVVGTTAFVAYNSLEIVDLSNPAEPRQLASWNKGSVADVEVVGNLAYVAAASDGLIVFDVQDPTQPKRLTRIPAPGFCISAQVVGQLVYTSAGVYDVSDPVSPVRLAEFSYPMYVAQIHVEKDMVYLPTGLLDLKILRMKFGTAQTLNWGGLSDVILASPNPTSLTVSSSSGLKPQLQVITGPASVQNNQLSINGPGKVILKATQEGNDTYLPIEETRLLNQPYARVEDVSTFGFETNIFGARVVGTRAYVGNDVLGLHILDVSNPAKPVRLGIVPGTNQVLEAQVEGRYAYIADGIGGLKIADISNPADPTVVTALPGKLVIAVTLSGKYAYVSDLGDRKFIIADISNPAEPKQLSTILAQGEPRFVRIVGNLAYLASGSGGLFIYDISNPAVPVFVSHPYAGSQVRGVDVVGDTLYVLEYGFGDLVVFNVADPFNPVELGRFKLGGNPRRIQVENGIAFVVSESKGLQLVDVADPAHMVIMDSANTGEYARDIHKIGNQIYVADQNAGLRIFDLKEVGFKPSVDFHPVTSLTYGQSLALTGSSSHAQPVQYRVVSGPGQVRNGQLVPTDLGLITVRAEVAAVEGFMSQSSDAVVRSTSPGLSVQKVGPVLDLSWPAGLAHASLEHADILNDQAAWEAFSGTIQEQGGVNHAALPAQGQSGFVRLSTPFTGVPQPLQLTGWNRDVILENAPNPLAQAFDLEGSAWFEDGLGGYLNGLPQGGRIVDRNDRNLVFQLQPYTSDNVLWLDQSGNTGTLKVSQPVACSKLHILAAAPWERPTSGTVTVRYVDGTTSGPTPFLAHTWLGMNFSGEPFTSVFPGVGKSFSAEEFNYVRGEIGFHMYQTEIDLGTGPQAGKAIAALEFERVDTPGYVVGIFAVSGIAIPSIP